MLPKWIVNLFKQSPYFGESAKKINPTQELGVSGTSIYGGYVFAQEKNPKLSIGSRYKTASDVMANTAIVAAGLRYFLNLIAKPKWTVEPINDTGTAKEYSEFVEQQMYGMYCSWRRIVRRSGMYKFHGFGINEWQMKKLEGGKLGYLDIESRPQHTVERWEVDEGGSVIGMWQRSPQSGREIFLPRGKVIYLLDDSMTDSPEGLGWFRNVVEHAERMKLYLTLESIGFERDLSGIPVGRAPITAINRSIKAGRITKEEGDKAIKALKDFVKMEVKKQNTGMILDSQTFENQTADGIQASGTPQWGIELLTGSPASMPDLGAAINRLNMEIALILGVESMLIGSSSSGSFALSKDKSNNLYLQVNSTTGDMAETFTKDFINPLWIYNGFPEEYKPRFKVEDVAFRDVQQVTAALRDMASAGALLQPEDDAINDVRDLLGISRVDFDAQALDASLIPEDI